MRIAAVGRAFPTHYYDQDALIAAFKAHWGDRFRNLSRLEQLHRKVLVGGRHLALPIEAYSQLNGFGERNDAFIRCATDLGLQAITQALIRAELTPQDIDHIMFVSSTGIATPSVDALLVNRLEMRSDIKRTPVFGLGCAAGAAGVARLTDYLKAYPDEVAVLLSVELCSLTLQHDDFSVANLISSGLFGDGAAAVVLAGCRRPAVGPKVVATRAVFYPHSEHVMGWKIGESGFGVLLSADVPKVVTEHIGRNVDDFLDANGLTRKHIKSYICHTGGPKVLEAFEQALDLPREALALSWRSLEQVGNLSSASVLSVLHDTLYERRPHSGEYGLLISMGPGFGSQLVLLRW